MSRARRHPIQLKRAYEQRAGSDGQRFLVERLWPRGVPKSELGLDAWVKDVAPSASLRAWYAHELARWPEFKRRYLTELRANRAALVPIREARRQGPVTLIYAARDNEHNSAVVLRNYIMRMR